MSLPLVTILIPNYKTYQLTKLCLRLLRKYTSDSLAKVIVIDNNSQDDSLAYLKNLRWITLIQRQTIPNETPALSHSRALDLALERVETPYVISIHTDTLVKNSQWLDFLLSYIQQNNNVAGVGSWKLEFIPWHKRIIKFIEKIGQKIFFKLTQKTDHALEGIGKNYYYLRSHCALYRMEFIKKYHLTFSDENEVAGKVMHRKLLENGHEMKFLPSEILIRYLDHINHATMVLNPGLGTKNKSVTKGLKRIEKNLQQFNANMILANDVLDQ